MARSVIGGQPGIVHAGCFDQAAVSGIQDTLCQGSTVVLTGTTDKVPFPGVVALNGGVVDACTLSLPISGPQPVGDDGKRILIVNTSAKAHTVTTPSGGIMGSKQKVTFAGAVSGETVVLQALGGMWLMISTQGGTLS